MSKERVVVADIEANGLINVTRIWCIACRDINTGELFKFQPNSNLTGHLDFKNEFIAFAKEVKTWIGHNFLTYDMPTINEVFGEELIKPEQVIDTLVLSRLFRYQPPPGVQTPLIKVKIGHITEKMDSRYGGHSLGAWGTRLNFPKYDFNDWSQYTAEMGEYNVRDIDLSERIYKKLLKEKKFYNFSDESITLEHNITWMLHCQEVNGFYLDKEKALELQRVTTEIRDKILNELTVLFPPVWKFDKVLEPKINKDGSLSKVTQNTLKRYNEDPEKKAVKYVDTEVYNLYKLEHFNPGSGLHIVARLQSMGWNPKRFTDKGNPKTDRESLQEAIRELLQEHPDKTELRSLADYDIVQDRLQRVTKWLELSKEDGRIHGKVLHIGAWTHRCSHYNDNMANVASVEVRKSGTSVYTAYGLDSLNRFDLFDSNKRLIKLKGNEVEYALTGLEGGFGWESRDIWSVPDSDHVLIGCDASGIQLRALAHYMGDPDYIRELVTGDIHEVHRKALGIPIRHTAKTFIYAWLLGAGDEKIGLIIGVDPNEINNLLHWASKERLYNSTVLKRVQMKLARDNRNYKERKTLATIIKGFKTKKEFLERIPALKQLRTVTIPEAVKASFMTGLDGRQLWLPNEHLAMGAYLQGFEAVIMKKAMQLYQFELQRLQIPFKQVAMIHDEFQIEGHRDHAEIIGQTVVKSIQKAGELYGSKCPLDGEFKVGKSWAQTH